MDRRYVSAIKDKLEFLTEQQKWVFFQQSGLLDGRHKFVNFTKALISNKFPISEIENFIEEKESLVDLYIGGEDVEFKNSEIRMMNRKKILSLSQKKNL